MNTDFVPLSSLLETMKTPSFEELSEAEAILAAEQEIQDPAPASPPPAPAAEATSPEPAPEPADPEPEVEVEKVCSEPKILLDRDGDRITRIRVLCSCGQSIHLDCDYGA